MVITKSIKNEGDEEYYSGLAYSPMNSLTVYNTSLNLEPVHFNW
jgi:hypothetical protein